MPDQDVATDGSAEEIWKEALQRYQQTAGQKLEPIQGAHTLADIQRMIESEIEDAAISRGKHAKIIKLFQAILIPVQLTTNVLAGGENTFGPGAFVFSALRVLIRAIKDVTTRLDGVEDLLSKIQHFTTRLSIYTNHKVSPELRDILIQVLAALIEVFAFCTKAIKLGRFRTFGKHALLGEDRELRDIVSKLDQLTSVETQLVGAETYTLVNRQNQTIDKIAAATTDILEEVKRQGLHGYVDPNPEKSAAYSLLLPTSYSRDMFDRIAKERLAGTGEWLHNDDIFQSWLQKSIPVLWIPGVSGAGKSFLSQALVSYLQEERRTSEVSIAYFFFRADDAETRSLHHALKDLAYQISVNDPEYVQYLTHVQARDIKSVASAWRVLFMNFFTSNQSHVYLVLDGIDEANEDDRDQLFSILQDLTAGQRTASISVFLTGRPHLSDHVEDALQAPSILVETRNSDDIATFTEQSIEKSRLLRRISKELQKEILDTLVSEANGMFFWVDLMLKNLKTKPNGPAIQAALHQAPRGLKEMLSHVYEDLMNSLPHDVEQLKEIFAWVTFATRNLTLEELDGVLQYASNSMLLLERKLRKDWASFLTLTREDGRSTEELEALFTGPEDEFESQPSLTNVMFRHTSIGDFFHSDTLGEDAPAKVLRVVLMALCDINAPISLHNYAQRNWLEHLGTADISTVPVSIKADIGTSLVKICRNRDVIEVWSSHTRSTFWEPNNLEIFRKWLWNPELLKSLPSDEREWIQSLAHPIDLFYEKANLIAHKWLQDKHWAPDACFRTLSVFLIATKELDDGLDDEARIKRSAEWAKFDQNAGWHHRLGVTLRMYNLLDAAQEEFEAAIQLNPSMALAYAGLALVYEERKEMEKALEVWQTVVKVMKQDNDYPGAKSFTATALRVRQEAIYWKYLGDIYKILGREEEAYQAMRDSWKTDPTYHDGVEYSLEYLSRRSKDAQVIDILVELRSQKQLTIWILSLTIGSEALRICRWAARTQDQMDFWVDAVQDALSHCQQEKRPVGEIFTELILADIYYFERVDPAGAVRIWHRIENIGISAPETNMWLLKLFLLHRLAPSYFLSGDVEQLKRLTQHKIFVDKAWFLLGRWYETHDRHEDALQCYTFLADKAKVMSEEKDRRVYLYASQMLLHLNQENEARAVVHKSFAREDETENPSDRAWYCDGDCSPRKVYSRQDPAWVCRECFDIGLCKDCAERQKSGTLKVNICSSDHELLKFEVGDYVMPPDEILIDGELVDFDEWAGKQRERLGV